jgi:hypothetical protein
MRASSCFWDLATSLMSFAAPFKVFKSLVIRDARNPLTPFDLSERVAFRISSGVLAERKSTPA